MKTRRFTVLLVAALLLAACGAGPAGTPSSAPAGDRAAITFAAPDGLVDAYRDLAAEFEGTYPDAHVAVVSLEELLGPDLKGSVSPEAATRVLSAADTAYWYIQPAVTQQGLVRDLTPFLDADPGFDATDFYPGLLDAYRWDQGTWAVPSHVMITLLFYDKDAFDQAARSSADTVSYPQPGWTWDEFIATAHAVTLREGSEVSRYGYVDLMGSIWASYLADHGVLHERDGADLPLSQLDSPAAAAALRWYIGLVRTHQAVPALPAGQEGLTQAYALVSDGRAAMWTDLASNHPSHPAGAGGYAGRWLGVVPFPSDGGNTSPVQVFGYVMSAGTSQPDAAWRWLSFLTRQGAVGRSAGVPARRSVAEATGLWDRLDDGLVAALRYAMEHPLVSSPAGATSAQAALEQALTAVLQGSQDVEQALAEAQQAALAAEPEALPLAEFQVPPVPTPAQGEDVGVTITFITSFRDPAAYRALAEDFHEIHPDINVDIRPFTFSGSSGIVGIEQMAAEADCFRFHTGSITPGEAQVLLSLDPLLNATAGFFRDDYYPGLWQMCEQGGQLWCLPYDGRVGVVRYNKALFDAAGVPYPEAGWTLDDLVAKALALSQGERADQQYGFSGYTNEEMALDVVLRLRGGALWDTAAFPPRPQFDDLAVVDAVRWYANLAGGDGIRPVVHLNLPVDQWLKETQPAIYLVEGGKVAMWTQYADTDPYLQTVVPSMGMVPFPQYKGRSTFAALVEAHYISAQTEHPQACWDWLTFLSDQVAAVTGAPVRRSLAESAAFQQKVGANVAAAYLDALQASDPALVLGAQPSWMGIANHWFRQAYDAVLDGTDAVQALGEAQQKAEAYVACLAVAEGFDDAAVSQACAREVDPEYPDYDQE
jgi:multiple sugar transport system substrate-binding protein